MVKPIPSQPLFPSIRPGNQADRIPSDKHQQRHRHSRHHDKGTETDGENPSQDDQNNLGQNIDVVA
jgi:hypothetical protein